MEERLTDAHRGRTPGSDPGVEEVRADVHEGVGTVVLDRPAALNAISWDMLVGLRDVLEAWSRDPAVRVVVMRGADGKAFCAGGDVRQFYRHFKDAGWVDHEFFTIEYELDFRIHTYPKPVVALIDGIVMGGGMGLAQGAALRIVGERTRMAMPETAIGLFPDVGGSYFLPRAPGAIGFYLGLAGPTIGAADALYAGLADVYLPPASVVRLDEWVAKAAHAGDPGLALRDIAARDDRQFLDQGELDALHPTIDRHFNAPTVDAIVESLSREHEHAEWARRTREALLRCAPLSLKVTLEQLRRGRGMGLADCFRMELDLVRSALDHTDFFEGIRALLIDKDRKPRWDPPRLEDVRAEDVERFFGPHWPASQHPLSHLQERGNT
jgi:enoyl-CoA hydratase/carnithine racemase